MEASIDVQIGQMIMVGFRGTTLAADDPILDAIRTGRAGSVWVCDFASPSGERLGNIDSPAQLAQLIASLQAAAPIPLLVAIDAEGGRVIRLKPEYGFPPTQSAAALGAADDLARTAKAADDIAATLTALGVNLNLAPVVDLNRAPDNPSLGGKERCFSSDADCVTRHAATFIRRHHASGLACAVKHFPGQGSALHDAHLGIADVTETWSRHELTPFIELFGDGLADAVLVGHVSHRNLDPDRPATLSRRITTDLLRGELGYDGVVICDDLGMGAIRCHYEFDDAIAGAIDAGADIILHGNTGLHHSDIAQRTSTVIRRLVETGRITESRIRESYRRICRLKAAVGHARGNTPT